MGTRLFGPGYSGQNCFAMVGMAVGGFLGGYLYDISHTYVMAWLVSFGAGLLSALLGMDLLTQGERAKAAQQAEVATPHNRSHVSERDANPSPTCRRSPGTRNHFRFLSRLGQLANAVVIPITGWLARVLGARQVYIYALILFTSSAVICGMMQSVGVLIFFRILQGIGGGVIMPVTMLLMLDLYPLEKRGLGIAIWGMGASCGSLTGIPLGGILAEQLSWRAAFYANLPPGLIALLIASFVLRPSPRERHVPFDWGGFITMSTALTTLLVALSNGQREGWGSSPIVTLFAISGIALAAFLVLEPRVKTPMIDLRAFRSLTYVLAVVLSLIAGAMFTGGPFLLSLFLQRLYDFSVQQAALIMFPSSAFLVLCTSFTGWASDHIDHRPLMILGYLCYCTFGVLMLFADLRFTPLVLLVVYFGRGLGLGFTYSVLYPVGISAFEPARAKAATTVLNLCVTLGGTWAVALLAAILDQRQQVRQAWLAETQQLTSVGTQQALETLAAAATQMGSAVPPTALLGHLINQEALILAFNDASALFIVISLCGLILVPFFRRVQPAP